MGDRSTKKLLSIKTVIIILSVQLVVCVAALGGVLVWRSASHIKPATVTVPDNVISPETENGTSETETTDEASEAPPADSTYTAEPSESETNSSVGRVAPAEEKRKAAVISLYRKHAEDNQPFQAGNMFPGDTETKYFCVKIFHSGDVIVRYHADVRPGYEKLAEVLRCRIVLLTTGETLYDGLMRDMPELLNYTVKADESNESELYYEVTAYLDTGVGNEYQNKDLIADFRWWVQDTEYLDAPQTGVDPDLILWFCIASGSLLLILFLAWKRRKEECENG